jgi:hypothetical protein
MGQVIDFNSLLTSICFKFGEVNYSIPPISNSKAIKLMSLANEMGKKSKEEEESGNSDLSRVFDVQNEFIIIAVVREDGKPITKEEINTWPSKMTAKVMDLINQQISGDSIKEGSEAEKKS